jgi:hypothetical protein
MPIARFEMPDGRVARFEVPEGTTPEQAQKLIEASLSVQTGKSLNSIPRQLGLTARYGLEGLANTAELLSEPIRYATDRLTGSTGRTKPASALAADFADWVGLPKPQGADERVVGDASRMLAGSMGVAGGLKTLSNAATGTTQKAMQFLAANPAQQATAAAGAGLAGGSSREAGGSQLEQGASALIGGLAGGLVPSVGNMAGNFVKSQANRNLMSNADFDLKISQALKKTGVDYNDVPERLRQSLRSEVSSALRAGDELNPDALSRLLDFKAVGVTPTRGMISQNPAQITREMNLAKMGANSSDEGLQGLSMIQNQNNTKLIDNLNALGAGRGDIAGAGNLLTSSILGRRSALEGAEQAAWDKAKTSPGYRQPVSGQVLSDINQALDAEGLMPFMSPQISKYIEAFQSGQQPFTPQVYRNLQSMLSRETMKGGNEGAAASLAAKLLRQGELKPAGFVNNGAPVPMGIANAMRSADNVSNEAIDAVNAARRATAQKYAYEDSTPLVRSVLSDGRTSEPERIAQSYIIGGTPNEAADVINQVGQSNIGPIKDAILNHLKSKALSGAADETGKFSQSSFNKALNDIGDRKLSLLFSPEELTALRTNGRVAALMQSQPPGSAVNNSNSAAMLMGRGYDAFKALAGKMPFGQQLVLDPLQNISLSVNTRRAQNVLPGLIEPQKKEGGLLQPLLLPAGVAAGGLLSAP